MTTHKQYLFFKKEVERLSEWLGLKCWQIRTGHIEFEKNKLAGVTYNIGNRWAEVRLNKVCDLETELTEAHITRTALHELIHLLLAELAELAQERKATFEEIDRAEHAIVRTLENVLLGNPK